jgi:hypothetical protein
MAVLSLSLNGFRGFAVRNPIYTSLVVFFLLCSTLLLLPWHSGLVGDIPSKFRGSMTVEMFVKEEELKYASLLARRHSMIQHYGPSPDQVDSYVSARSFIKLNRENILDSLPERFTTRCGTSSSPPLTVHFEWIV